MNNRTILTNQLRLLFFVVIAVLLAATGATASQHAYVSGTLLDANEYDWCNHDCQPFDQPTLFFCVQVDRKVLIGSTGTGWIWAYDNSKMLGLRGKSVSVRYDSRSIWIVRTDGKDMRLRQNYSRDVFVNSECIAEIHRHWLSHLEKIVRPNDVPEDAVLVPQSERSYFWVNCLFVRKLNWDLCTVWDETGHAYAQRECVNQKDHRGLSQDELAVDPLTTTSDYVFRLKSGVILSDWAKGRINNQPTPGSTPPLPPLQEEPGTGRW